MRHLTDHYANGLNDALYIQVEDAPGHGGACHSYSIWPQTSTKEEEPLCDINFQNGPIAEKGVNGVSHEALLAILIDRLQGFQSGQYACRENAMALTKLEEALMWLRKRTLDRVARGVEGTSQK